MADVPHVCQNVLTFKMRYTLFLTGSAEPLKKKKKLDPAIVRAREERKKRRIEKSIKKLEKNARQLKPIEEAETPISLLKEKKLESC